MPYKYKISINYDYVISFLQAVVDKYSNVTSISLVLRADRHALKWLQGWVNIHLSSLLPDPPYAQ